MRRSDILNQFLANKIPFYVTILHIKKFNPIAELVQRVLVPPETITIINKSLFINMRIGLPKIDRSESTITGIALFDKEKEGAIIYANIFSRYNLVDQKFFDISEYAFELSY